MSKYELVYHAGIPGRAEFIRLYLEATGTPYEYKALTVGQDCIKPYLSGKFEGSDKNPTPFAVPVLKDGDVVISQTPNILLYLSTRISAPLDLEGDDKDEERATKKAKSSPASFDNPDTFHANALTLTILDLNNEVHDTHHPISVMSYYEDQKDAAKQKADDVRKSRLPKFLANFEKNLDKSSSGFLLPSGPTYADLALFQLVDGLKFAFPARMKKLLSRYPKVESLYERILKAPRIKAYLESDRRQKYSMGVFRYYEELDGEE
ncbi:glutathione S-transferase [Rhodotorula toruloides]|uniref:Glutathione S-transferase n=1 Tax=Rhodotorula toruloides TaxID=5286 RepID=A0A511KH76_RHOTO|nr:glutathione S-transferase [Rhodotorula toruloides]